MLTSWDVEDGKPVKRPGRLGQFATQRAAVEMLRKGRMMFQGRYRTYIEIMEYMRESREWSGSVVQPLPNGWRFMHPEGAEMFLRATAP